MNLYTRIKDNLLERIKTGVYPINSVLPSEIELAKEYNVSRATIRQAIQMIVSEGYLDRRRRRGTIVVQPKVSQSFAMDILSFNDDIRHMGRTPRTHVLLCKQERARDHIADKLELKKGSNVLKLVRLRYVDDVPNVFVETYLPIETFPGLAEVDFETESFYHQMKQYGSPIKTIIRTFEALKADEALATLLDLAEGDPIIRFETLSRNAEKLPIEYSIASYRGESNSFSIRLENPDL